MGLFSNLFGKSSEKEETMNMEPTRMNEHNPTACTSIAKDPVCGMEVNKEKAQAVLFYLGQTRYFCSPSCLRFFRTNPDKYIKGERHEMADHSDGHRHI